MNRVYSQRTRRSATGRFIADNLSLTDVQNADRTSRTAYHPLARFVEQLRPIILTAFVVRLFYFFLNCDEHVWLCQYRKQAEVQRVVVEYWAPCWSDVARVVSSDQPTCMAVDLFRECWSRCGFQPYDCVIIRFVE